MVERKSELTRKKIIEVSKHLFYAHGFQKTSLRQIATACDINQSLIYYYFDGKEALAAHIMEEFAAKVKLTMRHYLTYEDDPLLFMLAYVRMLLKEASKDPHELDFYCEVFHNNASDRPHVREIHEALLLHFRNKKLPFQTVQIAHILSDSAWSGLICARKNGEINWSISQILQQVDRERFHFVGIPPHVLDGKMRRADELVAQIPVQGFHIVD